MPSKGVSTRGLESLLVPAAMTLPSNAEYLAHLDVAGAGDGLIRLASNENTEPPSPLVREALERSFADANLSPPPNPPVRDELAERFEVTPDRVLVGAGSTELIEAVLRTFVRAGDEVVLPAPSWPVFERRLAALEAQVVKVPLHADERSYSYDVDALLSAVSERTKVLIVCTPNNPTGNSMALDDVRRCAELAPMLLVDAAYADFDPNVDVSPLVHEYPNLILTRTFSKAYCMAGLRLGYAVGDATVLDHVDRFLVPGSSVSSAALHAGLAALRDDDYHDRQVQRIVTERERLLNGLRALGLTAYESRGNFVAVDASGYDGGAAGLAAAVLRGGVVIRRMTDTIARISVGTAPENDVLLGAVAEALELSHT
ncbi:MAG TPA: histidinol-phosphate transaminase [Solirubrobacteraceae bacterium]|nr:histidinol-phosphate transaminase [Solirubrobacteraceae bacterium]